MMHRPRRRPAAALTSFGLLMAGITLAAEPASLPELNARVDRLFAQWDTTRSPGCSMAASRNGSIVHARGYGMANMEHGVPNGPRTVFHIASVSKQFTAAAIAMLVEEGRLSLGDPVRKFLPGIPAFAQGVTVGHLVHHTSGIRDHSDLMELAGWRYYRDLVTTEDAMSVLARQRKLIFAPGSRYQYNNTNYLLLGEIVQRVSGKSLRQFATERLFEPLGMKDSFFRDDFYEIVPNFAAGYEPAGHGFRTSLTNFSIVGYSTLLTTVEDLMKWEENFYGGRVGGKAITERMLERAPLPGGKPNKYAFGIVVDEHRGLPIVEHSGGDAGYSTHLVRFPQQHLSVTVLCNLNSVDAHALAMQTAEIYLGLPPEKPANAGSTRQASVTPVQLPEATLQSLAGHYLDPQTERAVVLTFENGALHARIGEQSQPVVAMSAHRFRVGDGRVELEFPKSSRNPSQLALHDIYDGSLVLRRVADDDARPLPPESYAGTYHSEEIEAPFHVLVEDGQLILRSIKYKARLIPVTPELFIAGWANVLFSRDAAGRISGFRYGDREMPLAEFARIGNQP